MTNTAAALLASILAALTLASGLLFGGSPTEVTGVYAVPGGELTVFADESARFEPNADALVAVDVPEEDQTSAVSQCLLELGYRGTTSDRAERLYVLVSDLDSCSLAA